MKKLKEKLTKILSFKKKNPKVSLRLFTMLSLIFILILGTTTYLLTYCDLILEFNNDPDYVESGVSGSVVYVNDLEADYYFYQGQNYIESDGTLPTTENKNIYNDETLVQTKIIYYGDDGKGNVGYVSNTERQNTYIYFKTIFVNDNNTPNNKADDYIEFELIDNPFSDRPTDRAFNGWTTNYVGAEISFNGIYYERYVKVPVTYTDNKPTPITISLRASWVRASVYMLNNANNFTSGINSLKTAVMQQVETIIYVYEEVDMTGYYYQVQLERNESCTGYYNDRGQRQNNCTCRTWGGCTYYDLIDGEMFDENNTYYRLQGNTMREVDNSTIDRELIDTIVDSAYEDGNMSSYYRRVTVAYRGSIAGYYDNSGNYQESGTCNTNGGCTYYELIQYYKDNGTEEIFDESEDYYYLATRDTNIVVMTSNISGSWGNTATRPFTLTSLHNGTKYNVTWNANAAVNCYSDVRIENLTIYYTANLNSTYNPPTNTTTAGVLYGRYNNVKIGRGIAQNGNYPTFRAVIGGNNAGTGSNGNPTKYKLMIETGIYNSVSLTNGAATGNGNNHYFLVKGIYGNDYDRVENNNEDLDVYYCASGSWSGAVYASTNSQTSSEISLDVIVKSGTFGSSKYDLTTGIYVGGRYGGNHYSARRIKVEGGYIFNINGGPLTRTGREEVNDIFIFMTGGTVDMIYGGAGTTATYGNRIISITGGTVNYSVFGGSNGADGDEGDGTLNGTPYIYIGGTATIGNETYVNNNNTLWGAEAGSVFGIGNGSDGSSTIGSSDNSIIIIDGKANIKRNVYGGGNFGATGVSSDLDSTYTKIIINGGFIDGSVYGGGNRNGAGSTDKAATITVTMTGGNVVGSVYGGSNVLGTIYGSTNVNILGGEISTNVYGGGQGGYTNNNSPGTFVRNAVNIVVGDTESIYTPIIDGSVYGGSAFGTVNGTTNTTQISTSDTNVTVNKGIITNVYGGGQGNDTYQAYVLGDIKVTINGGNITNVFGGNDKNGIPNGNIEVYINDGTIESTYGGGNETSAHTTNVYLNGGTSEKVFGGSNISGEVETSNVISEDGTFDSIYGGNNQGGTTEVTNVEINGGNINYVYGGGEKTSVLESTNVEINNCSVTNVFGGSNLQGEIPNSYITINNGTIENTYGGNNQGGTTEVTHIEMNSGTINYIYGGGLKAETGETNVNIHKGTVTNVFGGGSEAGASTTNVGLGLADIEYVYGGSNLSGDVTTSNIFNIEETGSGTLTINTLYGGNNQGGVTTNSNIDLTDGEIDIIYGGGNQANTVETNVSIDSVKVTTAIYGGGNEAETNKVTLSVKNTTVGSASKSGNIFGGGNAAPINTTVDLTISENTKVYGNVYGGGNLGSVLGTVETTINNSEITENIYGAGNLASVGSNTNETSATLEVTNSKALNIYGGGNAAAVNGSTDLTVSSSTVTNGIYGGGNGELTVESGNTEDAKVSGNTTVNINNNTVTNQVFGGGNAAPVDGNSNVTIESSEINGTVYAGGNGVTAVLQGNTNLEIKNVTIGEQVFGGGNAAPVGGNSNVTIDNSEIEDTVYAGGNGITAVLQGNTNLEIKNGTVGNQVFGGGNAAPVNGESYVYISGTDVTNSVYAGGNGVTAILNGNTNLDIDSNTKVGGHVFGGGNAAATGNQESNNSKGIVNIAGANIKGNVYGGANTSVLYGDTTINIGYEKVTNKNLIKDDIFIGGTVFGGGEANASGSEDYDFNFISVTIGININIDGQGHDEFDIKGSIFGSGNASSTEGYSYIHIANYGSLDDVKKNVSIQRANIVTLDNSHIELSGAKDRTNEYFDTLFTISRVDEFKIKNNSALYLQKGANLLKKFSSLVDENGQEVKAYATIDKDNSTMTRNVNNRLYLYEGVNLNILLTQTLTSYGEVNGMTFFGMYNTIRDGQPITALYSDYSFDDSVPSGDIYYFTKGSYILGEHKLNHDITIDGFYSNYGNEEGTGIIVDYVDTTPKDSNFYMWSIGEAIASYDVSLVASKYSTLGTLEMGLLNHTDPNTTFTILGVNFGGLDENISLIDYQDIPRIAPTEEEANSIFGLSIKSGTAGFVTKGSTDFLTEGNIQVSGTTEYKKENSNVAPSFIFYFYHSKNITIAQRFGAVTISLVAVTPIDDLNNDVERININIELSTALFNTNEYEGTMTAGKQYEMFANSTVNITNKSSFSGYYSLFMQTDTNPYKTGYHRTLVSTYVFPVNTKITMIDFHEESKPVYYYYVVDQDDFERATQEFNTHREATYKLSDFIKMGSTSPGNNYDDEIANSLYYKEGMALEEFIFIVDFKDSGITTDILNNKLLIELKNADSQTLIGVLGIAQSEMNYNLYNKSDVSIELDASLSKQTVYIGENTTLTLDTIVDQTEDTSKIKDTNYYDEKLGILMTLYDSHGNKLSSSSLLGINFEIDGVLYYPRYDGSIRLSIAESVANTRTKIKINTLNSNLATDTYKLVVELFSSPDGIYYGSRTMTSDDKELTFNTIGTVYGLSVDARDETIIVNKDDGYNQLGNNINAITVNYNSALNNANIRLKLYRRDYSSIYTNVYNEVDLKDYITNEFTASPNENEYYLTKTPAEQVTYYFNLKDNLTTGTYKLNFMLYDGDTFIGDVYRYIIIR
ncbi:MAG: hypothetical protein IJO57_03000 [Bacilli bacterium]|nr:hypothetical protein [Bacilli bacterium]